jgi:hydrogenase small subunit
MAVESPRSSRPTTYEVLERHGVSRRDFLNFCAMSAAWMGLDSSRIPEVVRALESKPRLPVLWLHGLECTCCSESFIRSSHPIAQDVILNMISLDYDDTLQAAAGHQVEQIRRDMIERAKRGDAKYVLAVEGNIPTADGGVHCTIAGETFEQQLRETAAHAEFVIAWGSCASNGCVQAAAPNPTRCVPVHAIVRDRPVVKVPGCPPIAEVMTGVLTYVLTFGRLPELDRIGRPKMFYGTRLHDQCYRRAFFDNGQFVESWDDEGAKKGWCLYKMGCRGPTTYNSCATVKWNNGVSWPIGSGHGCIGCSEANFWDDGPLYERLAKVAVPGIQATPETIGKVAAGVAVAGVAAHLGTLMIKRSREQKRAVSEAVGGEQGGSRS